MKKFLVLGLCVTSLCVAEDEIVVPEPNIEQVTVEEVVVVPEPNLEQAVAAEEAPTKAPVARGSRHRRPIKAAVKPVIRPIEAEDLERVNHAIDCEEDIHVVSVDYEEGKLKHMKIEAFVVSGDVQLSTMYELSFGATTCDLLIEDYITGIENAISQTDGQNHEYATDSYAVQCFKEGEKYCSKFERTCLASFEKPAASGWVSCQAPAEDELQVVQKMQIDNEQLVSSMREGIQANIRGVLEDDKRGTSFAVMEATAAPGKVLRDLFESKLRVYFYEKVLSTLLLADEPDTLKTQPAEHTGQV